MEWRPRPHVLRDAPDRHLWASPCSAIWRAFWATPTDTERCSYGCQGANASAAESGKTGMSHFEEGKLLLRGCADRR